MRYVVFDVNNHEIRSAVTGAEPAPGEHSLVGDVGDVQFDGAVKNYVLVPRKRLTRLGPLGDESSGKQKLTGICLRNRRKFSGSVR